MGQWGFICKCESQVASLLVLNFDLSDTIHKGHVVYNSLLHYFIFQRPLDGGNKAIEFSQVHLLKMT